MAKVIARISLVPGHAAYFDELSNTYLTWGKPIKNILEGTNVKDLRKSVAAGTIKVIEGSLGHSKTFKQVLMEAKSKRTGEPLKKLMGKSKIVDENGNYIDEIVAPVIEKDAKKSVSTIDAGKATTLPKASIQTYSVAVEDIKIDEATDTNEAKTTAKKTKTVAIDELESPEDEGPQKTVTKKRTTKKATKKN